MTIDEKALQATKGYIETRKHLGRSLTDHITDAVHFYESVKRPITGQPDDCRSIFESNFAKICQAEGYDPKHELRRHEGADGEINQRSYTLTEKLAHLLNYHSMEQFSDTPDFILAEYMMDCFRAWNKGIEAREKWHDHPIQR